LLGEQKRTEDAENVYKKAIELDPSHVKTYYNLNALYQNLKRYGDAFNVLKTAIDRGLGNSGLYYATGFNLQLQGKLAESLEYFEKSENFISLASVHKKLGNLEKSGEYLKKARELIKNDNFYDLACIESIADNIGKAIEFLALAAKSDNFNSAWAWDDPDLEWIRDDPRFQQIAGPKQ